MGHLLTSVPPSVVRVSSLPPAGRCKGAAHTRLPLPHVWCYTDILWPLTLRGCKQGQRISKCSCKDAGTSSLGKQHWFTSRSLFSFNSCSNLCVSHLVTNFYVKSLQLSNNEVKSSNKQTVKLNQNYSRWTFVHLEETSQSEEKAESTVCYCVHILLAGPVLGFRKLRF